MNNHRITIQIIQKKPSKLSPKIQKGPPFWFCWDRRSRGKSPQRSLPWMPWTTFRICHPQCFWRSFRRCWLKKPGEGWHIEIDGLKKGQKKREFRELWIAFEPVFRNHLDPFMVSCWANRDRLWWIHLDDAIEILSFRSVVTVWISSPVTPVTLA
jgi:hypothetical protein